MDFVDNVIDRSIRHHPRPRRVRQSRRPSHARACSAASGSPVSPPAEALLVPDAAIGTEQVRKFVLVVGADNIAHAEICDARAAWSDGLRVVKTGSRPTTASSSTA